jgi:hypothetical protein
MNQVALKLESSRRESRGRIQLSVQVVRFLAPKIALEFRHFTVAYRLLLMHAQEKGPFAPSTIRIAIFRNCFRNLGAMIFMHFLWLIASAEVFTFYSH